MAVIELKSISRTYHTGGEPVHALRPLDLSFEEGVFTAIMGPSGSGKSTMLNLLGLLDRPSTGQFFLEGEDVSSLSDNALSEVRCRKIGMIFQAFNLFPGYTVLENVCVPMRYADKPEKEMYIRAKEMLALVGLADRITHRPTQLSGGQCQRVAIARALVNDPAFILADEPTGNLDEKTGEEILAIFRNLRDQGRTVIMVTHNPDYTQEVERVVSLHDGSISTDVRTEKTP
jgi:putative ABC transport system ATP-binding protein